MPGPGNRGSTGVPQSKGLPVVRAFATVHPLGQSGVNPAVVAADLGSLTLAGFAPTVAVSANQRVLPDVGALTLAGFSPTVLTPRTVRPGVGVLTATGLAPTVLTPRVAKPGVGVLSVVGLAPTLVVPRVVRSGVGALAVTGFAPTITVAVVARPGVGALTLNGFAPVVVTPQVVRPAVGVLSVAGFAPLARIGVSALPGVGALTLSGFAPTVSVGGNALLRPGVGSLLVDGFAPTVIGDPVSATLPAGGWMQPIRRAKAQPFTVWSYETFAPSVVIAPAQRFRAVPLPRPAIAASGVGSLTLTGYAPSVLVSETPVAVPPEHEPDATGEPVVAIARPHVPVVETARLTTAPLALPELVDTAGGVAIATNDTAPDAVPAWLASPIVVDVGYATLLLDGFAPTIAVTSRTIPTDSPWSPESEDDDAAMLWAAYDLLVNA